MRLGKLDELLDMLKDSLEEKHRKKIPVGTVTDEVVSKFEEFDIEEKYLNKAIELRANELAMEAERQLNIEFRERKKALGAVHDNIWKEIYEANNLDPEESYNVNRKTKTVYQYVDEDGEQKETPSEYH